MTKRHKQNTSKYKSLDAQYMQIAKCVQYRSLENIKELSYQERIEAEYAIL